MRSPDPTSLAASKLAGPATSGTVATAGTLGPRAVGWSLLGLLALAVAGAGPALQDDPEPGTETQIIPSLSAGVTADSNDRMIAVTGMDMTGSSVLYLVDTITGQLCVYQASGGSKSTRGVRLVGARNISLDLRLDGFNDKTESEGRPMPFKALEKMFNDEGLSNKD